MSQSICDGLLGFDGALVLVAGFVAGFGVSLVVAGLDVTLVVAGLRVVSSLLSYNLENKCFEGAVSFFLVCIGQKQKQQTLRGLLLLMTTLRGCG